jgi:hypothetical protein
VLSDQLVLNISHEDKQQLRAIALEQEEKLAAVARKIIRQELLRRRSMARPQVEGTNVG